MTQVAPQKPPKKSTNFVTPAWPCKWPKLLTPDTKFYAPGEYSVELIVPPAAMKAFFKNPDGSDSPLTAACKTLTLEQRKDAKFAKADVAWPIKDETDDDGNLTGNKLVRFSQKMKEGFNFAAPEIFDTRRQPIPHTVKIGNGTIMRVAFNVRVTPSPIEKKLRVMFHVRAAQIITLVEWKPDYGFAEEEGYVAATGADPLAGYDGEAEMPSIPMSGDDPIGDALTGKTAPLPSDSDIPF